ncbi:hypothetical protein INS49_007171 [Diaporthe citri]|uniref:uncharacterized protein n=1 Tax=Diaporthe citri TaxID=83186 RepID=UPI001C80A026|nr:uncharacterized protein INS49_007171 [Diaporthe citri]KAG6365560.1 hypothetical protein INS49_007171 [Diaporthe citri]
MTGSGVLDGAKKVGNKMAMGVINAIAGSRVATSGSVDGVPDDFPRPSKGGKCPPHLLKRTADKEADKESVATNEEVSGDKK